MTPLSSFYFTKETLHALDCAALSCSSLSVHKHLHWSSLAPPGPQRTAPDPPLLAHQSPVCTAAGPAAQQLPLKLSTQHKITDISTISLSIRWNRIVCFVHSYRKKLLHTVHWQSKLWAHAINEISFLLLLLLLTM